MNIRVHRVAGRIVCVELVPDGPDEAGPFEDLDRAIARSRARPGAVAAREGVTPPGEKGGRP